MEEWNEHHWAILRALSTSGRMKIEALGQAYGAWVVETKNLPGIREVFDVLLIDLICGGFCGYSTTPDREPARRLQDMGRIDEVWLSEEGAAALREHDNRARSQTRA